MAAELIRVKRELIEIDGKILHRLIDSILFWNDRAWHFGGTGNMLVCWPFLKQGKVLGAIESTGSVQLSSRRTHEKPGEACDPPGPSVSE